LAARSGRDVRKRLASRPPADHNRTHDARPAYLLPARCGRAMRASTDDSSLQCLPRASLLPSGLHGEATETRELPSSTRARQPPKRRAIGPACVADRSLRRATPASMRRRALRRPPQA
jgi:hypothetical protein